MENKNTLQTIKHKSAMAVPSLFTIGNLACGFFSILSSVNGNFHRAGWLIFIAMFLDGVDGRVARMLKAESEFGVEMDSLADLISFCAAPAFLVYFMALQYYAVSGAAIAFIYLLCGALRLAKFNTMALDGTGSKKHFSGLPTPAAAGILAAFAVSYTILMEVGVRGQNLPFLNHALPHIYNCISFVVIGLAFLMVSKIPYAAFKGKGDFGKNSVWFILFAAIFVYLTIKYPQNVVLIVFSVYVLVGIIAVIFHAFKNIK
ncbi:CDP-diacylglycerol--serine O-phosphatidyltransferase [Bacteroidia bacterium]|nr:CDP-diacylglycerol--serine O-phosphatidyltransferase [Bacteroidia bacterium]